MKFPRLVLLTIASSLTMPMLAPAQGKLPQTVKKSVVASVVKIDQKAKETVILFIGDSLTEGYGVDRKAAYPTLVEQKLNQAKAVEKSGKRVRVINAGISGSVTAEADRRLKWQLRTKPDILVLALGGNDALKGTPTATIKKNLGSAIDLAKANDVKVLLAGIRVYSNFGSDYAKALEKVYSDLAREKKIALMPFLLEGVALDPELNQGDMKHPNAEGHKIIADNVVRELEKLL